MRRAAQIATKIAACACAIASFVSSASPKQSPASPSSAQNAAHARIAKDIEAEAELEKALAAAGNDSAAVASNLKEYLNRYPDSPRKVAVYRALIEACQQIRNTGCAIDYAERLIALRPDDADMMLLAANLLQKRGDDASLTRAAGYITRVLDQTEKAVPDARPARQSITDWQAGRNQLLTTLYYVRGEIEQSQHDAESAAKDFEASYKVHPNAVAAEALGEMAESRHDLQGAIDEYALAFVLPENGPAGTVDRRDVRLKIGNVWRQLHGDAPGLGEVILAAYDRVTAATSPSNGTPPHQFPVKSPPGGLYIP